MEVIAGLLLLLLVGDSVSPSQAARAVERSIRVALPSAQKVDVEIQVASRRRLLAGDLDQVAIRIDGYDLAELGRLRIVLSGERPAREGRIGRLVLEALNGRVPISGDSTLTDARAGIGALDLAAVRLELDDVTFDMAQIGGGWSGIPVHRVGHTRAVVELTEAALNAGLSGRIGTLRDASVTLEEPDGVRVYGVLDSFVPLRLQVTGRLAIRRQTQVVLVEPRVNLMGLALPDSIVHDLAAAANPLLDVRQWEALPVKVKLERVGVRGSAVVAEGEVRLRRQRIRAPEASETTYLTAAGCSDLGY